MGRACRGCVGSSLARDSDSVPSTTQSRLRALYLLMPPPPLVIGPPATPSHQPVMARVLLAF